MNCPACNKTTYKITYDQQHQTLLKTCNNCGTATITPQPKNINKQYKKNKLSPTTYYQLTEKADLQTFTERITEYFQKYGQHNQYGTALDIGCNIGTFLKASEGRLLTVGIEPNDQARKHCLKKKYLVKEKITQTNLTRPIFDLIHCSDIIEHIPNPQQFITHHTRLLKQNGIIFFSTPQYDSLAAKLLGQKWHHYKPNEHIHYFTKKGLRKLLKRSNLQILEMGECVRYRSIGTLLYRIFTKKGTPKILSNLIIPFSIGDEIKIWAKKKYT